MILTLFQLKTLPVEMADDKVTIHLIWLFINTPDPSAAPHGRNECNLPVLHPPRETREEDLSSLFKKFGKLVSVDVAIKDPFYEEEAYGFVCFDTSYSATNAINAMDDHLLGHKRLESKLEFRQIAAPVAQVMLAIELNLKFIKRVGFNFASLFGMEASEIKLCIE
ncbi:CUGBP Elav-like family member 5 [Taenia solium]|eukprot:TsM_000426500 transcript=TsM_000426500 gene=TsM_000426500